MSAIADETVLLRYLLDDDPIQSPQAAELIATGEVRVYPETIARTVVALRDVYDVPRAEIARAMTALLDDVLVNEPTVCALAIRVFGRMQMDFTDCLLVARAAIYGDDIKSFGKPLIQGVADFQAAREGAAAGGGNDAGAGRGGGREPSSAPGSTDRTIDQIRAAGKRRR